MKYAILLYSTEDVPEDVVPDMQAWFDYTAELEAAGVLAGGEALQPSTTATTVRVRNDESLLTDGPFAETKEVLGGFYLVDVDDLDAATAWAAKAPSSTYGSTEVRPLMELPDAP